MRINIIAPEDQPFSVTQRILDGTLDIDSPDEFRDILEIYPDDPFLYRKYADLLDRLHRIDEAVKAYERTADLFIDNGMNLQAIVSKILQWRRQKPGHDQGRAFHGRLQAAGSRHTPLQQFWAGLSYPELVTLMRHLSRVRMAGGQRIVQADQPADALYFVVQGSVAEMPSPACQSEAKVAGIDVEPVLLGTNDLFGEVFPLDQPTENETEILAVSKVELVKIDKSALLTICDQHPRIKSLLETLYRSDTSDQCERSWQTVRRALRCGLPARVEIACPPNRLDTQSWYHDGMAVDISTGGICVDLGADTTNGSLPPLKGRLSRLNLALPNAPLANLNGKIVWQRRQTSAEGATMLIGIRFDTLNVRDRQRIAAYCQACAEKEKASDCAHDPNAAS
ncbi:MAG: PilZ domain-containing protein [Desulfatitalea sp.]|nr:PilZ domain-containing protein [Desulfatitalea sp.]